MTIAPITSVNVKQAVPFFGVSNMEASLRFYVDGLGFKMKHSWIPDRAEDNADGRIRWCWLQLGDAAIMLQEFLPEHLPNQTLGTLPRLPNEVQWVKLAHVPVLRNEITVQHRGVTESTMTNEAGVFRFDNVAPGTHQA